MPLTLTSPLARRAARRFTPALAGPVLAFALAGAAGCGGSTTDPIPTNTLPYTVGGTLRNVSGATVPSDARVVLVWAGDDGSGDYSYVWGSGPVDAASGRFSVTLASAPPAAATFNLKSGERVGVAFAVLVPAGDVAEGRVTNPAAFSRALGAAGQHAVIYVDGTLPSTANWTNMRQGYNVGRGVAAAAGQTFDGFEAVGAGAIDLVVDALRNIKFVNWT